MKEPKRVEFSLSKPPQYSMSVKFWLRQNGEPWQVMVAYAPPEWDVHTRGYFVAGKQPYGLDFSEFSDEEYEAYIEAHRKQ